MTRNDVPTTVTPGVVANVNYSIAASPLALPRCLETRPPPTRRHDSGIIGKTSLPIQVEPTPLVFALHLDAAENNEKSGNQTWVIRNTNTLLVFWNEFTCVSSYIFFSWRGNLYVTKKQHQLALIYTYKLGV
ncbi:hypothetical protein Hanom_Chr13g01244591 [Helianthus anomalus]